MDFCERFCASTFNSRPHEEVDAMRKESSSQSTYLSIHDLTRRSTFQCFVNVSGMILSIHDLTRRSTLPTINDDLTVMSFNSRPHEEVDAKIASPSLTIKSFNSRPHEEVDPALESHFPLHYQLSIHDLTRRSTRTDLF